MSKHTKARRQKVVTVCLANAARSPTAEWLLLGNYRVKSCGTSLAAHKPCDNMDMRWADKVVVMEQYQKQSLETRFPKETAGKIEVLEVPEIGKYACQPSLIDEISDRLKEHHFKVRTVPSATRAEQPCLDYVYALAMRKDRGRRQLSYALTDYWSPSQEEEYVQTGRVPWQSPREGVDEHGDYYYEWGDFSRVARKEKTEKKLLAELKKYTDMLKDVFK